MKNVENVWKLEYIFRKLPTEIIVSSESHLLAVI
jgi:hypothetical protein